MYEFILIFALMLPETGMYKVMAQTFKTMEACEAVREEIGKNIIPTKGVSFVLLCERGIPSDASKV